MVGQAVHVISPGGVVSDNLAIARLNADGSYDTTFAGAGWEAVPWDPTNPQIISSANAVAIQPDGSIVVVGTVETSTTAGTHMAVERFLPDGTLDTSFGNGGKVELTIDPSAYAYDTATGVALQPDGKIVVIGNSGAGLVRNVVIARLDPDGTLDTSFSGSGLEALAYKLPINGVVTSVDAAASAVTIEGDGRIVIAGAIQVGINTLSFSAYNQTNYDCLAVRLNPNGTTDSSFRTQRNADHRGLRCRRGRLRRRQRRGHPAGRQDRPRRRRARQRPGQR